MVSSISPCPADALGRLPHAVLLLPPPWLSMSEGGGDLFLEWFGPGSPCNVGAVTTGKGSQGSCLPNGSWLGACFFQPQR